MPCVPYAVFSLIIVHVDKLVKEAEGRESKERESGKNQPR